MDSVHCEGQKILAVFCRLSTEAWFAAILYELTTRAYLATLLDKIDLDNFVEKAPDANIFSVIEAIISARIS